MYCGKSLDEIKEDLAPLSKYWVILYGSCVGGWDTPRSDIDVAVITRIRDVEKNKEIYKSIIGKVKPIYDVRVFELLPLHIKIDIIDNYVVVFGDRLEISEYFYHYRKLWKDVEKRYRENQFKSYKEKLEAIKRRKRLTGETRKQQEF